MLCTRLYVESTYILIGQGKKRMILILPKELFENMRNHDSFHHYQHKEDQYMINMNIFRTIGTILSPF